MVAKRDRERERYRIMYVEKREEKRWRIDVVVVEGAKELVSLLGRGLSRF